MSTDQLRYYYQHLYPYETIQRWLTYNKTIPLQTRQLSFQYENGSVQRYVKFKNALEMRQRMTSQLDQPPRKVDAGAVWTGPPAKDNKQFKPKQRQFIFDFDMNDYDDVRTCCEGKKTCQLCWKFMIIAKQVISTTLSEDFGFTKMMFVFSGGRGMHIWVCDDEARRMPDSLRKSIVDYLQVITGNNKAATMLAQNTIPFNTSEVYNKSDAKTKQTIKKQKFSFMNPHVVRSIRIIKKWFIQICNNQNTLTKQKGREIIYRILQNKNKKLKERVEERWSKCEQSTYVLWNQLCEQIDHYELTTTDIEYPLKSYEIDTRKIQRITFLQQQIILTFLYPRMDYNVSTMQNHLLKLPFSIHPSSKKVSVPMFINQVETFNPKICVDIDKLMEQLKQLHDSKSLSSQSNEENARKTSLSQYLRAMESFCTIL